DPGSTCWHRDWKPARAARHAAAALSARGLALGCRGRTLGGAVAAGAVARKLVHLAGHEHGSYPTAGLAALALPRPSRPPPGALPLGETTSSGARLQERTQDLPRAGPAILQTQSQAKQGQASKGPRPGHGCRPQGTQGLQAHSRTGTVLGGGALSPYAGEADAAARRRLASRRG